jgi:hypothetical protein
VAPPGAGAHRDNGYPDGCTKRMGPHRSAGDQLDIYRQFGNSPGQPVLLRKAYVSLDTGSTPCQTLPAPLAGDRAASR